MRLRLVPLLGCILLAALLMTLTGCAESAQGDTGKIRVSFDDRVSRSTTFLPNIQMEVSEYEIAGKGPGERTFTATSSGESVVFKDVYIGEWTIQVTAKNEDGIAIGFGEVVVEVKSGETTNREVSVDLLGGNGTFMLNVSWDETLVANPHMTGKLSATWDDNLTYDLEFTLDDTDPEASSTIELCNGFYTVEFAFFDGDPAIETPLKSLVCAAWIVAGGETTGTVVLTGTAMNLLGTLSISIKDAIQRPFDVVLTSEKTKIPLGKTFKVSSTVDPSYADQNFRWYLDGTLLDGETGDELLLENLTEEGWHNVELLVTDGYIISSDSLAFQVKDFVEFPDENLEAVIREKLGQPEDDIMRLDCLNITSLNAFGKEIISLEGLQYLENLESLKLAPENYGVFDDDSGWTFNFVSDLTPLENLVRLRNLNVKHNLVVDISPLANLTELTILSLNENQVEDISPLANLTKLVDLRFNKNKVNEISSLFALTNLEVFWASDNQDNSDEDSIGLTDIAVVSNFTKLTYLCIGGNDITDFTPIANLNALESIEIWGTGMDSTEVFGNLPNLQTIKIPGNHIDDIAPLVANAGIGAGDELDLNWNNLDLSLGSDNMNDVETLRNRGVTVYLDEVN